MKKLIAVLSLMAFTSLVYAEETQQNCNTYCTDVAGSTSCSTVCSQ